MKYYFAPLEGITGYIFRNIHRKHFKGIDKYFKVAILADDTTKHKPDPEPIYKCLDKISIKPEEAIFIGDSINDYLAAKNAGVDFGYATWGSVSNDGIDDPTYVFNHPLDLLKLL